MVLSGGLVTVRSTETLMRPGMPLFVYSCALFVDGSLTTDQSLNNLENCHCAGSSLPQRLRGEGSSELRDLCSREFIRQAHSEPVILTQPFQIPLPADSSAPESPLGKEEDITVLLLCLRVSLRLCVKRNLPEKRGDFYPSGELCVGRNSYFGSP